MSNTPSLTELAERVASYNPTTSQDNRADELTLHQDIVMLTGVDTLSPSFDQTFLRSIDSAMTLVPSGWSISLFIASKFHSTRCTLAGNGETVDASEQVEVIAIAPPLAIVAAALKSLALKEQDHG